MAQLANRDAREEAFARKFGELSATHRKELNDLLGNPPDADNVPQEFWDRVTKETEDALAALILLIMLASAGQHLDLVMAPEQIPGWMETLSPQLADLAAARAAEVADGYVDYSKKLLAGAVARGDLETLAQRYELTTKVFGPSRVEGIAVNETTRGTSIGADKAIRNTVGVTMTDVWITAEDENVCPICDELDGTPRSYWGRFFPMGPEAHVGCILPGQFVVPSGKIQAAAKSFYEGPCVEITLSDGTKVSVTENHPVLTTARWKPAHKLRVGEYLLSATDAQRLAALVDPNAEQIPALIEDVFASLKMRPGMVSNRMPASPEDFHGDGRGIGGNVQIVYAQRPLAATRQAPLFKHSDERALVRGLSNEVALARDCPSHSLSDRMPPTRRGFMCARHLSLALSSGLTFPFENRRLMSSARGNSSLDEIPANDFPGETQFKSQPIFGLARDVSLNDRFRHVDPPARNRFALRNRVEAHPSVKCDNTDIALARQFLNRRPGLIAPKQIIKIRRFDYSGHVFDLQVADFELYACAGVIVHNCRCYIEYAAELAPAGAIAESFQNGFSAGRASLLLEFDEDEPRDDHGRWVSGGAIDAAKVDPAKAQKLRTKVTDPKERKKLDAILGKEAPYAPARVDHISFAEHGGHAGTPADPIPCGKNLDLAVRALADGKSIRLKQPEQVSTLLDKMHDAVKDATARGEKAPNYNLCGVSVPGTNLFCHDSKGVPRAKMPQMKGLPIPGSPAADPSNPRDKNGKVDLSAKFIAHLQSQGYTVEERTVRASHLRASQNEIVGAKIADMVDKAERGKKDLREAPIFVTDDHYVLDGHHHWAAIVGLGYSKDKDLEAPVHMIHGMGIGKAIDFANAFAKEQGIAPKLAESLENPDQLAQTALLEADHSDDGARRLMAKNRVTQLLELTYSDKAPQVDRDAGIIRGVKILGRYSRNDGDTREYSDEAMEDCRKAYEGLTSNVNHPPRDNAAKERGLEEGVGWISGARVEGDGDAKGVYGDLNVYKNHRDANFVFEKAERNPRGFGMSHNAEGKVNRIQGRNVVESVSRVRSVDVVQNPATNVGLFESFIPDPNRSAGTKGKPMPTTLKQLFESSPHKKLAKLILEAEGDNPYMEDEADGDDTQAAIRGLVSKKMADKTLDPKKKKKHVNALMAAHDKLSDSDDPEVQESDDEMAEACMKESALTPNDDMTGVDPGQLPGPEVSKQGKAGKFKEQIEEIVTRAIDRATKPLLETITELKADKTAAGCSQLLESMNREPSAIRIKALLATPAADRKALVESWPERQAAAPRVPRPERSFGLIESAEEDPGHYEDSKSLMSAIGGRRVNKAG